MYSTTVSKPPPCHVFGLKLDRSSLVLSSFQLAEHSLLPPPLPLPSPPAVRDGTLSFHPGSLMLLGDGLATAGGGDLKYLLELRAEAQYFGLIGLVDLIDRYPYAVTPVHRASAINSEDSWVYEDGQDQARKREAGSPLAGCRLLGGECICII